MPETDAIFANLKATDLTNRSTGTKRLSLDFADQIGKPIQLLYYPHRFLG